MRGGDVLVFWAGMALMGALYQRRPEAVEGAVVRKGWGVLRGEGWVDRAAAADDRVRERGGRGEKKEA